MVDDHPVVIDGIRFVFDTGGQGRVEMCGSAGNGLEAIDETIRTRPDVILMDIDMLKLDGIEATKRIRQMPNAPEVIITTAFDLDDQSVRAGAAGASGFLLKSEGPGRLISSIEDVARGDGALSPRIAKQMLVNVGRASANDEVREAQELYAQLMERERDIADLVAQGMSNREIGGRLHLSESTIKTQLSSIHQKFGVDSRVLVGVILTRASFGAQPKRPAGFRR